MSDLYKRPYRIQKVDVANIGILLLLLTQLCIGVLLLEDHKIGLARTDYSPGGYANGIYFPGSTMCVYLEGRTLEEINHTLNHEYLHYLIDTEQGHFCDEEVVR